MYCILQYLLIHIIQLNPAPKVGFFFLCLSEYDIKPKAFVNYLRYYGPHFNKKLCDFACEHLEKAEYSKEKLDILLQAYKVELKEAKLQDAVYVANWAKSTFFGSGISDEKHLVLFIKDIFEKEGDLIFNRWYADMAKLGIPIEWEEMV